MTILKPKQVRRIRTLLAKGKLMIKAIAAMFGVSPSCISDIKHGRTWRDLPED